MKRRLVVAASVALLACGDVTGIEGLVPIPVVELKTICGQHLLSNLQLYGPPGSTTTDPKPGRWVVRGSYDLTNATVPDGSRMDSALIVMTFQQDLPYQNDSTSIDLVGHMVRRDNLTGTFEADGGFVPTSLAPGAPMARVQTDNGYYLSCVLFR